jgi:hypothetical protein
MYIVPFDTDVDVLENRNPSVERVEESNKRFKYMQLYSPTRKVELDM